MYNHGDKVGNNNTNHSANMVSEQVTAQMAALEERNGHLEDNHYKLNDAIAQLVRGDTIIGGEDGITPVLDTKCMISLYVSSSFDKIASPGDSFNVCWISLSSWNVMVHPCALGLCVTLEADSLRLMAAS